MNETQADIDYDQAVLLEDGVTHALIELGKAEAALAETEKEYRARRASVTTAARKVGKAAMAVLSLLESRVQAQKARKGD